ncbi:LPS export ABC transporter ATP-binding protein [Candidatus Hydrogenosomobacter endosymbioticus]|uniref:ABC transporter ATP-binding protein n=1 Tax=Candidatus Hydrogenosomobacter endosymbioticus TaxID=2558174 RepID=A0ABN6L6S6_9PROT|nr:LPS export ABC transporter ATP-binding protein [Candidatus Hydrogenosomobacter endosymbioticus]BDB96196.1 ABC transporter ATP-binding protein [Candidatus Hydrogenosomobacter endosymbioticus]
MKRLCFFGQNLYKKFRDKDVVSDVSISLFVGEAVGLLGPNGAGKTTSFLMMAGLVFPDKGSIFIGDIDASLWPLYRKARFGIRYLPQESSIFRGMNVEDNIMAVLELLEPNARKRKHELEKLLSDFNLLDLRKRSALLLSGGERRRVEIARALAGSPKFLLLDEPLAGIDPKSVDDIRGLILHLKERGIGVLITDHNVRDTLKIVDRAYIIYEGRILQEGSPQEIANSQVVRRVYLGDSFKIE